MALRACNAGVPKLVEVVLWEVVVLADVTCVVEHTQDTVTSTAWVSLFLIIVAYTVGAARLSVILTVVTGVPRGYA